MAWTIRDPELRQALRDVEAACGGRCAFAGELAVQLHVAARLGPSRAEPPAHHIDVIGLGGTVPEGAAGIPVRALDAKGFDASIAASRIVLHIEGDRFTVAAPEHVLGLLLLAPEVPAGALWSCFVLLRVLGEEIDLEEVRGFVKRSDDPERQTLLAELAYLAA